MGQTGSVELSEATKRVQSRVGRLTVSGRYHRLPKRLEDDYKAANTVLGSGYNGQVFLATHRETKEKFAIKAFKLHGVSREKKDELTSECEIFLSMDHPHVARLVDVYESQDRLDLVMECMSGGELFERVSAKKRFSEQDAVQAAYQMLVAINYIHSHDVVHRDLKLENFLYDKQNSDHLKLIDFGFSKIWEPNTKMRLSCGTLAYVAPEVLDKSYTSKCDLWSLGVIVFILLAGYMPFSGAEATQVKKIKAANFAWKPQIWSKISEQGCEFVKALLVVDPAKRLSANQALEHKWIVSRHTGGTESIDVDVANALVGFAQASLFRRACMNMMAWSLTNEERAQVRQAFMEMDKDHSGTIKLAEFKQILQDKFHVSGEKAEEAFHALDANNTEEIHYSEFLAAMVSNRIALHDHLLTLTFKRFDTDNSGYITAENLREVLGETFEGAEIDTLIAEADKAHDGKISYQEFIAYLKEGTKHDEAHADAALKVIETNKAKQTHEDDLAGAAGVLRRRTDPDNDAKEDAGLVPATMDQDQVTMSKCGGCVIL